MTKRTTTIARLLFVSMVGLASLGSHAQDVAAKSAPATFIFITTDVIKPGGFDEYRRIQVEKARVLKAAGWSRVSIGMTNLTGPIKAKVTHYGFYESFDDWGRDEAEINRRPELRKALKAIEDREFAVLVGRDVMAAVYNPEISYRGEFNWAGMRFLSVITNVLKPGNNIPYREKSAIVRQAHIAADIAENLPIYTNFNGGRLATYFLMRPVASHEAFDEMRTQLGSKRYKVDTLGKESQLKVHALFAQSVEVETDYYYAFDPELSYTTPAWAAGNLDFWKP